jgi:predicted ATPase
MQFRVVARGVSLPMTEKNVAFLKIDHWNDYSFITMFYLVVFDASGCRHDIGNVKIGFKGQTTETPTFQKLSAEFPGLDQEFFSLGQEVEFYRKIRLLPEDLGVSVLTGLRDIVISKMLISDLEDELVFGKSLLRDVSLSIINGQFSRVLEGNAELTDFKFRFAREESAEFGAVDLRFNVVVGSSPSTNIHALIGRNGIGKTTLLNGMISAIRGNPAAGIFYDEDEWASTLIEKDYFSGLVSVSFSAFDPFNPPQEQPDPAAGACYFYIGLKDAKKPNRHRTIPELREDCIGALIKCFLNPQKTARWQRAIEKLCSDENFALMNLRKLETLFYEALSASTPDEQADSASFFAKYAGIATPHLSSMSSGHAIVLLTITKLVANVEEKTLVLLDEPESHLHPPLLSAFIRALAELLHDRNGVAIIATHSPVVLQEIPKTCVWKIFRVGKSIAVRRPEIETFGENVGLLTTEVFSLEVERLGFHEILAKCVSDGRTFDEIVSEFNGQLGLEARAILMTLIADRDKDDGYVAS